MPSVRDAVEPGQSSRRRAGSARAGVPSRSRDLDQPHRVGRIGRADHQHRVALRRDRLDRGLAVRGRVADVLAARRLRSSGSGAAASRRPRRCRRPTASSGSGRRGCRDRPARTPRHPPTVSISVIAPVGHLAERADHLGMAGMADEDDVAARRDQPLGLAVDLGDQRAGRVEIVEPAALPPWPAPTWARRARRRRPARRRAPRPAPRRTPRPCAFSVSTTNLLWTISCRT